MIDSQRLNNDDEPSEPEYDCNWKHLWLAMYEDTFHYGAKKTVDSAKWQDLIIEKLETQKAKPEAKTNDWTSTALLCARMNNRAAELRKTAETHSIGSELARMRYNFAAAQIEKLAEELKTI